MDNETMTFSGIDHRNKFGLLCMAGKGNINPKPVLLSIAVELNLLNYLKEDLH